MRYWLTIRYWLLLYRQEYFTGKYTTSKIHSKLYLGPEWRIFHILTSEDIDDIICLYNKKKITQSLEDMHS